MVYLAFMLRTGHVRQRLVAGLAAWQGTPLVAAFSQAPSRLGHETHEAQSIPPTLPTLVGTRRRRRVLRKPATEAGDVPSRLKQETAADFNVSRGFSDPDKLFKPLTGEEDFGANAAETLLVTSFEKLHFSLSSLLPVFTKLESVTARNRQLNKQIREGRQRLLMQLDKLQLSATSTQHSEQNLEAFQRLEMQRDKLDAEWQAVNLTLEQQMFESKQVLQGMLVELDKAEQRLQSDEQLEALQGNSELVEASSKLLKKMQEVRSRATELLLVYEEEQAWITSSVLFRTQRNQPSASIQQDSVGTD